MAMAKSVKPKKKRIKNKGAGDAMAKVASKTEAFKNISSPLLPISVLGALTEYKPEFCKMLIDHMSGGLSFDSFAGDANVCEKTLYNWRDSHADFLQAYKIGKAKCRAFWEKLGVTGVAGKIKGFKEATYIYNMNNRFKEEWRNSVHHNNNDKPETAEHADNEVRDVSPAVPLEDEVKQIMDELENEY